MTSDSTISLEGGKEIIVCQECSSTDVDIRRLKFHILTQHTSSVPIVASIKFLCVKASCTFYTNICNVYAKHLMDCCFLNQTFTENERERLKSTFNYISNLEKRYHLNTVPGFIDYVSTFNKKISSENDNTLRLKKTVKRQQKSSAKSKISLTKSDLFSNVLELDEDPVNIATDSKTSQVKSEHPHAFPEAGVVIDNPTHAPILQGVDVSVNPYVTRNDKSDSKADNFVWSNALDDKFPSNDGDTKPVFGRLGEAGDVLLVNSVVLDTIVPIASSPHMHVSLLPDEIKKEKNEDVDAATTRNGTFSCNSNNLEELIETIRQFIPKSPPSDLNGDLQIDSSVKAITSDLFVDRDKARQPHRLPSDEAGEHIGETLSNSSYKNFTLTGMAEINNLTSLHRSKQKANVKMVMFEEADAVITKSIHAEETSVNLKSDIENEKIKINKTIHKGESKVGEANCKSPTIMTEAAEDTSTNILWPSTKRSCLHNPVALPSSFTNVYQRHPYESDNGNSSNELGGENASIKQLTAEDEMNHVHRDLLFAQPEEHGKKKIAPNCQGNRIVLTPKPHALNSRRKLPVTGTFKCRDCGAAFRRHIGLMKHCKYLHTKKGQWRCYKCGRSFYLKQRLIQHRQLCRKKEIIHCKDCGKIVFNKGSLCWHMKKMHLGQYFYQGNVNSNSKLKSLLCDFCGVSLSDDKSLVSHQRRHMSEFKMFPQWPEADKGHTIHLKHTGNQSMQMNHDPAISVKAVDKKFPPKDWLENSEKNKFVCDNSSSSLASQDQLRRPTEKDTRNKLYTCGLCGKSFLTQGLYSMHQQTHLSTGLHKCNNDKEFLEEKEPHHENKQMQMSGTPCKSVLPMGDSSEYAQIQPSPSASYKCDECGKAYNKASLLRKHQQLRQHTNDRKSKYSNESPGQLVEHNEKPFKCDQCGKSYRHRKDLKIHVAKRCGVVRVKEPFICEICGEIFPCKDKLTRHKTTHSVERPFKCDFCDKTFLRKYSMVTHRRTHTGEKPYVCSECGRSYSRSNSLSKHMVRHKEANCDICPICGLTFICPTSLRTHLKIHSEEKPFSCDQCDKSFRLKDGLTGHMRVHSTERPFACNQCVKSFKTKYEIKDHMKVHTGEKPYKCDECGKCFSLSGNLHKHRRAHKVKLQKAIIKRKLLIIEGNM